jgi:RimJ/RimL family protein N-acetyltransferase
LRALARPEAERKGFALIWEIDGEPIGFSSLKNIERGKRGEMHLHMWKAAARGKGYGGKLFCLSALDFYERFALQEIVCEPKASNPMPNGMLRKVGFPLVKTYTGASSELSLVCELNSYLVTKEIAARYAQGCA